MLESTVQKAYNTLELPGREDFPYVAGLGLFWASLQPTGDDTADRKFYGQQMQANDQRSQIRLASLDAQFFSGPIVGDSKIVDAIARVLHVAGRFIELSEAVEAYRHDQLLREAQDLADRDRPRLGLLVPRLEDWFHADQVSWMDQSLSWVGSKLDIFSSATSVGSGFWLGVRSHEAYKALVCWDERQLLTAKQNALYNAWLVGKKGRPYLWKVEGVVRAHAAQISPGFNLLKNEVFDLVLERGKDAPNAIPK